MHAMHAPIFTGMPRSRHRNNTAGSIQHEHIPPATLKQPTKLKIRLNNRLSARARWGRRALRDCSGHRRTRLHSTTTWTRGELDREREKGPSRDRVAGTQIVRQESWIVVISFTAHVSERIRCRSARKENVPERIVQIAVRHSPGAVRELPRRAHPIEQVKRRCAASPLRE